MPLGKSLTEYEKGVISALNEENLPLRAIARKIGRSLCVVQNFLACPEEYGSTKRSGGKRKLSGSAENLVRRTASNASVSLKELQAVANNEVSRTTIWRTLHRSGNIEFKKKKMVQKLNDRHKKARIEFALNNVDRNWNQVL